MSETTRLELRALEFDAKGIEAEAGWPFDFGPAGVDVHGYTGDGENGPHVSIRIVPLENAMHEDNYPVVFVDVGYIDTLIGMLMRARREAIE